RLRAAGARSGGARGILRGVPEALADRLRELAPGAARDGPHHRRAPPAPDAGAADRRRPRPVARADEGDAPKGSRLPADRPLAGEPLREPRPARGVEPRRPRVPRAVRPGDA